MVASAVFELCRVLNRHHTTYSDQMIRWTEGQATQRRDSFPSRTIFLGGRGVFGRVEDSANQL